MDFTSPLQPANRVCGRLPGTRQVGQSEYLVIYGGLQLGMAFLFAYFAWTRQPRNGLVVALAFYVPIVLHRGLTLVRLWPVEPTTMLLAGLEWVLLIAAAALWTRLRGRK